LRHVGHAEPNELFGPGSRHLGAVETHAPGMDADEAENRLDQCRFAGAIRADDDGELAGFGHQIDIVQYGRVAVAAAQLFDLEQAHETAVVVVAVAPR
jgi:hypothetical protein